MGRRSVILWFRADLRLRDQPLCHLPELCNAAALPIFCFDPRTFGSNATLHPRWESVAGTIQKTGSLRARFLLQTVEALQRKLRSRGSDLLVLHGHPEQLLPQVAKRLGGEVEVHCQQDVGTEELTVEQAVRTALDQAGYGFQSHWGAQTLYHLEDLPFNSSKLPEPFTAFRNVVENKKNTIVVRDELSEPGILPPLILPEGFESLDLSDEDEMMAVLGIPECERQRHIDPRCANDFCGGEEVALQRLETFANSGLATYKQTRDGFLGANYASKLSPWLAHGCISPRTVYHRVCRFEDEFGESLDTYWLTFELKWRDFFRFFALKYGKDIYLRGGPVKSNAWGNWSRNEEIFRRWSQGQTGVPFVDANMRELLYTGYMSNRGRQCVASFFTQDLKMDWRLGAQWFEHALLDHDVASNYGNWVCSAGVGMRGQRVNRFNMAKQAQQYDKDAQFIKLWVPEVANLPAELAMSPWDASPEALEKMGLPLSAGQDSEAYPALNPLCRPEYSIEARRANEAQNRAESAEVTAAGYPIAKRRWHQGRKGAFLAS
eukprot:TRINITY_DN94844_c0_g1_i1.p1 TRINITY_DN94844_c0_g1~~TRINITY_DN94844_c0_g1_i1.p1  ORF type:complete len:548 (-),score=94.22 TRINITY_DN94844_c0_g1_i1:107-1750(-)